MRTFKKQGIPVFVGLGFNNIYAFLHHIKGKEEGSHSKLNVLTYVSGSSRNDLNGE